jgi:hypothetical protein
VLRRYHEELSGEAVENRSLRAFCAEWLAEKTPTHLAPAVSVDLTISKGTGSI